MLTDLLAPPVLVVVALVLLVAVLALVAHGFPRLRPVVAILASLLAAVGLGFLLGRRRKSPAVTQARDAQAQRNAAAHQAHAVEVQAAQARHDATVARDAFEWADDVIAKGRGR